MILNAIAEKLKRRSADLIKASSKSCIKDPMRASGGEFTASAGEQLLEVRAMTQASCSPSPPITLDYENTLVLAIELRKTEWVLAAQVPGLLRVKATQSPQNNRSTLYSLRGHRA